MGSVEIEMLMQTEEEAFFKDEAKEEAKRAKEEAKRAKKRVSHNAIDLKKLNHLSSQGLVPPTRPLDSI